MTNLGFSSEGMNESTLVALATAGDHSAYEELCQRHSTMAMRMVSRILRNKEDVEDVLQDAMLNAYTHLDTFDGRSKFSTWFTRIAVNAALMLLRKRKRQPCDSISDLSPDLSFESQFFTDDSPSPESCATHSQLLSHLRTAIQSLPPRLKEVVVVRNLEDLSMEEVAQRCNVSVPAAKSRLLRARIKLASKMTPQCSGHDAKWESA